jgi:hypothetical protein
MMLVMNKHTRSCIVQVLLQLFTILLSRLHLELHNITGILGHLFVIANVNFLGALGNQSHIVTNHQHAALELVETPRQGVNGIHILEKEHHNNDIVKQQQQQ